MTDQPPGPPLDRHGVVELRQYTLKPGQRDVLIELFDREFVESQEALGIRVIGQFRDLGDPDRFVWLRSFRNMESRREALNAFYGGPVWQKHRDAANSTMVDSDNVLLLRPVGATTGFAMPASPRPPAATTDHPDALIEVTLCYRTEPVDEPFVTFVRDRVFPVIAETGPRPLAYLETEPAPNTFPALPVRSDENVFAWFRLFDGHERHRWSTARLARSDVWTTRVRPELLTHLSVPPEQLRLQPTARSALR